jgi:DNA-binding GntR family transcriptional regulator
MRLSPVIDIDHALVAAHDEAYAYILGALRSGKYRTGERLIAETIAGEIGTSRMPVREALRRLAAEGLVTLRANRGATVNAPDIKEMQEVFEMRAVLEGLAVRLAVPQLTPADLRRLEMLLEAMEPRSELQADWTTAHRQFHEALCARSDSPRLMRQISSLHSLVEPHMRTWASMDGRHVGTREHHDSLLDVIRQGDPAACEAAMRQHVMATVPDLIKHMASTSGP